MAKGRIGLSLSEDVLAILNEYGRADTSGLSLEAAKAVWRLMLNNSNSNSERLQAEEVLAGLERPTRTEIIEEAVRQWSARQHSGTSARPVKRTTVAEIDRIIVDPPPNTVFMTDDDLKPQPGWDGYMTLPEFAAVEQNSLSPEAVAVRTAPVLFPSHLRKAELGDLVSSAFEAMGHKVIDVTLCLHPAASRTTGKNWKCTACGYQA